MLRLRCAAIRVVAVAILLTVSGACSRGAHQGSTVSSERPRPASLQDRTAATRGDRWQPHPHQTWQWQLTGDIDTHVDAEVFDVDGFEVSAATVAALHAKGRKVVCYLDIGAVESYRSDAHAFPDRVIGRVVDGWSQERYLDIRRIDLVGPVLRRRFERCRDKGFDGVEGDLVDAYDNASGFAIDAADEERFIRWFARETHALGMAAGLKNVPDLVPRLVDDVDFAVVEDCYREGVCDAYRPFVERRKAVFDAEYLAKPADFCAPTRIAGISAIAKRTSLGAWRDVC